MTTPSSPPEIPEILAQCAARPERLALLLNRRSRPTDDKGRYLHWDELRHRPPPEDLSLREHWLCTKLARKSSRREVAVWASSRNPFSFSMVDPILEQLHRLDSQARGHIEIEADIHSGPSRERYLISSAMEEAITSSQMEGAATTRKVAKQMLASGRNPRDPHEAMIVNNLDAINWVREQKDLPCSVETIQELHRIVSHGTLKEAHDEGRFRAPGEAIYVRDQYGHVLHQGPDGAEIHERIQALCEFVNGTTPDPATFTHPIIRSIVAHFGLAYIHPFVDGNGRTARALFYWSMLKQGYWLMEFVSISRILKQAPVKYARAFLHTETDENDLNYFILHQLETIRRGVDALVQYVKRTSQTRRQAQKGLRELGLNPRQVALLQHALRNPDERYTIQIHKNYHGVVYQTARTDLLGLEDRGLLERIKEGKRFLWVPRDDLEAKIGQSRGSEPQ